MHQQERCPGKFILIIMSAYELSPLISKKDWIEQPINVDRCPETNSNNRDVESI